MGGRAMLIVDYVAISGFIVLTLSAGVERFLRGKRSIFAYPPRPRTWSASM
jgi:hypothetical protein